MGMAIHVRGGLAILTFCAALSTSSLADGLPRDLDEYITSGMEAWKIPGLSVVVVKDGAVVHAKGYGVLKAGEPEKVNEDTIFAIGSASKAFTAIALGTLVDRDKINSCQPCWPTTAASARLRKRSGMAPATTGRS